MPMRSAVFILVAVIAGLPLTARADLWINYKNLHVISTQRGCHLEHSDDKEKRSVVRCDPYAMTSSPHFTTYTQTWGRRTDDPRYGGCNTRSWTIALPPAKHQFDIELTSNSERAAIICKYNWQNNNTVDVYFLDKIPAKPLELHIRGIANASSIHLYNTGLCYWQVPGDPTTTSCKSAGEVGVTYLTPGGSQKRPCTVKIWPQLMFIVPMWHVQLLSNDGACHLTQVDHYNWNVNVKT